MPFGRTLTWRNLGLVLLAAMLIFAFWTLTRRPMLGMADNGDFWRITQSVGLVHAVPEREFKQNFVRCTFLYADPRWERLMSSSALVAGVARVMMRVLDPSQFDLRAVGLVYWTLLVAGVVGALRVGTSRASASRRTRRSPGDSASPSLPPRPMAPAVGKRNATTGSARRVPRP
jgi:hypothetical protein